MVCKYRSHPCLHKWAAEYLGIPRNHDDGDMAGILYAAANKLREESATLIGALSQPWDCQVMLSGDGTSSLHHPHISETWMIWRIKAGLDIDPSGA